MIKVQLYVTVYPWSVSQGQLNVSQVPSEPLHGGLQYLVEFEVPGPIVENVITNGKVEPYTMGGTA